MSDIQEIARQIAGSIHRNKSVCFFLGSGAAIDSSLDESLRLPNAQEIRQHLLRTPGVPDEDTLKRDLQVETLTPEMVWGKVVEVTKYSEGLSILLELFERRGRDVLPVPSTYRFLAKLVLSQCRNITLLTTNFDEKLEKAFHEAIRASHEGVRPILITAASNDDFQKLWEDTTGQYPHPILYKLHGTLSRPNTIVSTPRPLDRAKKKLLSQVVKRSDIIVFIGYSGRDADISGAFKDSLRGLPHPKVRQIYWCKHRAESTIHPDMKLFLDNAADMGLVAYHPDNVDSRAFLSELWRQLNELDRQTIMSSTVAEIDKDFCMRRCEDYVPEPLVRLPDPVHDGVRFTDAQMSADLGRVVDCGAIQRLRNIKQLSMAYYVFPDATHTRFSHSLGVAYLMDAALQSIMRSANCDDLGIDSALVFDCILAGLLHDIGHGPFGHSVEIFMSRSQRRTKRNHEDFTIEFVKHGLLDLSSALSKVHHTRDRVLGLLGEPTKLQPKLIALKMLLANTGFDVDRLDFLLRDLYHTGFDARDAHLSSDLHTLDARKRLVDTLLANLVVAKSQNLPMEERTRGRFSPDATILCFRDGKKLRECLDDFFALYITMYNWVYYRDLNRCAQAMLAKALSFAYDIGEIELKDIHAFTDQELFALLEQSSDNRVRELTKCVKYRYLFDTSQFCPQSDTRAQDVEIGLAQCLGVADRGVDDLVIVDIAPAKAVDDSVYLSDGETLTRYRFVPRIEALRVEYERLRKPRGHVFVPQALRSKAGAVDQWLKSSKLL